MSATMAAGTAPRDRLGQALRLFEVLFTVAAGWLELRALVPGAPTPERAFFPLGRPMTLRAAAGWAAARNGRAHVWFAVNPRCRRGGGRGPDVASVVALAVDLDAKDRLPTEERVRAKGERDGFQWDPEQLRLAKRAALAPLRAFPLPPTCMVDSGHGWQAYWVLKEPWELKTEGDRREVALLSRRLTATLGGDATFDLARVLRVPGTWNVKATPAPCRLVQWMRRCRYDPGEIEPYLRELAPAPEGATAEIRFRDAALPRLDSLPVSGRIRRLIAEGDAEHRYASRSEADMAVVEALVRAGVRADAIRAIYRAYPIGAKYRDKGEFGDDYLARTIARARAWLAPAPSPRPATERSENKDA